MTVWDGVLYEEGEALWLVVYWIVGWLVAYHFLWCAWKHFTCSGGSRRCMEPFFVVTQLEGYRRRLCRSQMYCTFAVVGGSYLLMNCKELPEDLLYGYTPLHQQLFAMAVGHWLVAIWEDRKNWKYLNGGLADKDIAFLQDGHNANKFLVKVYLWHHASAALGFLAILLLRSCTGVGLFGLLFELPVLLMNHREFVVLAESPPHWWSKRSSVTRYWHVLWVCFLVGRGGPSMVYLFSLGHWAVKIHSMSNGEIAVYHLMAIFFSLLNYQLACTFMMAWSKSDIRGAAQRQLHAGGGDSMEAGDMLGEQSEDEDESAIDESKGPLLRVRPEILRQKTGEGSPDGELWVEIDGIAYDVTAFQNEHPGGCGVFQRHAGKDASQGFSGVRHSSSARALMQKYMIGPVCHRPEEYRLFEHDDDLIQTFWEAFSLMSVYGFTLTVAGYTVASGPEVTSPYAAAVPSLLTIVMSSLALLTYRICTGDSLGCRCSLRNIVFGAAVVSHQVGMALIRQPLPTLSGLGDAPSGVEMAVGTIYLYADWLENSRTNVQWTRLGMIATFSSWVLRGAVLLVRVAPSHAVGACLLTGGLQRVSQQVRSNNPREEIQAEIIGGVLLSGVLAASALVACVAMDSEADKALQDSMTPSFVNWLKMLFFAAVSMSNVATIMNASFVCSPDWSVRGAALSCSFGVFFVGGTSHYRWLVVVGCIAHWASLGERNRAKLKKMAGSESFQHCPPHVIGTQACWDQIRVALLTMSWRGLKTPLQLFVNWVMPREMRVYAMDVPLADLGEGVNYGMAAIYQPPFPVGKTAVRRKAREEAKPGHFVCNVGHISSVKGGLSDMQLTMNTLRDVWSEFEQPDIEGLVANVVCLFPFMDCGDGPLASCAKEVNISAWQSAEHAHKWYMGSKAHRSIMTAHGGGKLKTFGNVLASLGPQRAVRHQDRCGRCARLVESPTIGELAPDRCGYCGGRAFAYPFF